MKRFFKAFYAGAVLLSGANAYSAACTTAGTTSDNSMSIACGASALCSNYSYKTAIYRPGYTSIKMGVAECSSCYSGGTLVTTTETLSDTVYENGRQVTKTCTVSCKNCVNCGPEPDYDSWEDYGTGYQRQKITYTYRYPECGSTYSTYIYRCDDNYYGSSTDGRSGCHPCPSVCNVSTTSTAGSNSTINKCCAPAGSTGTDEKGSFTLNTESCASVN